MMNQTLFAGGILLMVCCACKEAQVSTNSDLPQESAPSNFSLLESSFETVPTDPFYIYSSWETEADTFLFKGKLLDKSQKTMLPEFFQSDEPSDETYAACHKFKISENLVGLFIREPGEYSPTQIKLYLFDLSKDSIVQSRHVADVFGDAGEVSNYSSCLIRNEQHSSFDLIEAHFSSFTEIDDTITESSHSVQWLNITKNGFTEVSSDEAVIRQKYPDIVRNLLRIVSE